MRFLAALSLCLVVFPAEARPSRQGGPVTQFAGDRYAPAVAQMAPSARDVTRAMRCSPMVACTRAQRRKIRQYRKKKMVQVRVATRTPARAIINRTAPVQSLPGGFRREMRVAANNVRSQIIGSRPAGCPHRFCGCALARHIFGRDVRHLWLAANWFRFPAAPPAPGTVAVRRGHVFKLLAHVGGNTWRVWDANSGRGRIRIHNRSIAGHKIVNPHGGSGELSARRRRA